VDDDALNRLILTAGLSARWQVLTAIREQEGMFSLLPLEEADVMKLRAEHAIYMPTSGRINIAGLKSAEVDAVICLGCVIQGETRHFEFICQAVAQGIANVGIKHGKPAIFGVLTTDTLEQAMDRAGGKHGNKGEEAAVTAIQMALLSQKY